VHVQLTTTVSKTKTQNQQDEGTALVELIKVLLGIDADSSLADLNATSINDNNGGRIVL